MDLPFSSWTSVEAPVDADLAAIFLAATGRALNPIREGEAAYYEGRLYVRGVTQQALDAARTALPSGAA